MEHTIILSHRWAVERTPEHFVNHHLRAKTKGYCTCAVLHMPLTSVTIMETVSVTGTVLQNVMQRCSSLNVAQRHKSWLRRRVKVTLTIKKLTSSKTRYLEVIWQLLSPCIARVHRDKHCASWVEHKFGSLKNKLRLSVCNSFLNRVNLLRYYRQHLSKNTSH